MRQTIQTKHIQIYHGDKADYGADQEWFTNKWHRISGCGPTTAALMTMYMAAVFPETCAPLYPYALPAQRKDFVSHMRAVRRFVKPGPRGLTSTTFFAEKTVAFAQTKGVALKAVNVDKKLPAKDAFGYLREAVIAGYMPALLILRNPYDELDDFRWHWMAVTGFDDQDRTVILSTYGKKYELPFDKAWQQEPPYRAGLVYFYPA